MQLTTTDIAAEFNCTTRELRKFLRADARERNTETPGKGSRYSIPRKELRSLRTRFAKWNAAQLAKNSESATESDSTETESTDSE